MTISERRTKIRRERIIEFIKQLSRNVINARKEYFNVIKDPKATSDQKNQAYNTYVRKMNESFMFKYGVSMADPYGKWQKKFNAAYDEVEKEFKENENETT